ncbi:DUF3941 domain-containing protein [Texcoconibacillus texcoconensis]|uniref:DUF3941 domain-containing protein n=1 Tax=Texcoconibacillus texcoconensis TaxID=1095777 RepID=A0A840QSJ3_9BACI|nr:DUF3941 domain-containing protein [Texcoconibacillus texcoconensis]MBB5174335.1 hypothetical protein [Texcoconibacillus texcoconensis]
MPYNTKDNNKKPQDRQAKREVKNIQEEKNHEERHTNQYSKKTDHL